MTKYSNNKTDCSYGLQRGKKYFWRPIFAHVPIKSQNICVWLWIITVIFCCRFLVQFAEM